MKKPQSVQAFLGVVATARAVHAALVERGPEGITVVQTFFRQRITAGVHGAGPGAGGGYGGSPALTDDQSAADFTIQFGGGGGANLFLNSEFAGLDSDDDAEGDDRAGGGAFAAELSEILDECAAAGYHAPTLVFVAPSAQVLTHELVLPDSKKGRKEKEAAAPGAPAPARPPQPADAKPEKSLSHEILVRLLKEQQGEADPDRSAFLPMTASSNGARRVLALVARPTDPVSPTLDELRKQPNAPSVGFLDTELSLYLGLAAGTGDALVVRAGAENTMVLFLREGRLHHAETLRSLTAFDAPETICSRVLLQQDESGVDEVAEVLVLSEQRESELVASFDTFFSGARVRTLRAAVAERAGRSGADLAEPLSVPAAAAALRAALTGGDHSFPDVNLLSRRYLRRQLQLPFSPQVLALGLLLVVTALFFSWRYVDMQAQIWQAREDLRQFPPTLAEDDARTLQARIDSLENTYMAYNRALGVLDSLLVGSDRWSRTLEKTSRETAAVRGIWIETWSPNSNLLTLEGTATARDRVVALAERTGGDIERLTFSEIREWPVYNFTIRMPLPSELPEAAEYLRLQALARVAERAETAPDAATPSAGPEAQQAATPASTPRPPVRAAALAND